MTLRTTIQDREWDKFVEDTEGKTAVRIKGESTFRISGLNIGGRITEVTIDNTSWTALPASPLAARNTIAVQNVSGEEIKINYDSGVAGYKGIVVASGSERTYDISDAIILYAKSISSTVTINVEEIS